MNNDHREPALDDTRGFFLTALSVEDKARLHETAFTILDKVGLKVESGQAAELFHGSGAVVEGTFPNFHIRLPSTLVSNCIDAAPKQITYYGRIPEVDFPVYPGQTGFTAFGQCVNILDTFTGKIRPAEKTDMAASARLQDELEEIRVVARTLTAGDQISSSQAVHCLDAILRNTRKHITGGAGDTRNLKVMLSMLETIAGGPDHLGDRPFYSPSFCPTSPLTLGHDCCEVAIEAARAGLGLVVMIMPLSGGTAPATLAGTVALGLAEQLAGLVLVQLARKGAPVTMGSATTIMDLKTAVSAMGAPESGLINAGLVQMAAHYGLPSRVACGVSDAKSLCPQSGYEYAVNALSAALSGATIVFGGGALESGLTHSPAKLVMDHECMGNIRKISGGLNVSDETLALDVIREVGPSGDFLTHLHTFQHMREQSRGEIFDRKPRATWEKAGKSGGAVDLALQKAKKIMAAPPTDPLPDAITDILDEIVADFDRRLIMEQD